MKIKTKFELGDEIIYLQKTESKCSERIVKKGRVGFIKIEIPRDVEVNVFYILYDKTVINEIYCFSSIEELKEKMLKDNEYKIKNLCINSIIRN